MSQGLGVFSFPGAAPNALIPKGDWCGSVHISTPLMKIGVRTTSVILDQNRKPGSLF